MVTTIRPVELASINTTRRRRNKIDVLREEVEFLREEVEKLKTERSLASRLGAALRRIFTTKEN